MRGRILEDEDAGDGLPRASLGGVIAPMATDGKTLFVPVVNHSVTVDSPAPNSAKPER